MCTWGLFENKYLFHFIILFFLDLTTCTSNVNDGIPITGVKVDMERFDCTIQFSVNTDITMDKTVSEPLREILILSGYLLCSNRFSTPRILTGKTVGRDSPNSPDLLTGKTIAP